MRHAQHWQATRPGSQQDFVQCSSDCLSNGWVSQGQSSTLKYLRSSGSADLSTRLQEQNYRGVLQGLAPTLMLRWGLRDSACQGIQNLDCFCDLRDLDLDHRRSTRRSGAAGPKPSCTLSKHARARPWRGIWRGVSMVVISSIWPQIN